MESGFSVVSVVFPDSEPFFSFSASFARFFMASAWAAVASASLSRRRKYSTGSWKKVKND